MKTAVKLATAVAFVTGLAVPAQAAAAPVDHPCSAQAPSAYPVGPWGARENPQAPVNPVVTVSSNGGGSFKMITPKGSFKFVPRGADYVQLTTVHNASGTVCATSAFDVAGVTSNPADVYNEREAAQSLASMEYYRYNTVSVGFNAVESDNPAYWSNVANFINTARAYNIRVIIHLNALPNTDIPKANTVPLPPVDQSNNENLYYLEPVYIRAEQTYATTMITTLAKDHANLSNIFAVELQGETVFKTTDWPLNQTGWVGKPNGLNAPYNMSSTKSRNAMMDQNLLHWENTLVTTIHPLLPHALVAVGFTLGLTKYPGHRIGRPQSSMIAKSKISYIDFHLYPIFGPIKTQIGAIGVNPTNVTKPIVMGEFGEYASETRSMHTAAATLVSWEKQSCDWFGFRFSGWITWTWNTEPWEQHPTIYNMADSDYAIAKALNSSALHRSMATCQ